MCNGKIGVKFNAPPNTNLDHLGGGLVFTTDHLTDTDKDSTGKYTN